MLKYLILLLFINTYGRSSGNPVPHSIGSDLVKLGQECKNTFLTNEINKKIDDCNIELTPYDEKEFECLLFYDINKQLCDTVASSKIILTEEENTKKINEGLHVEDLCNVSKEWAARSMSGYIKYQDIFNQVFKNNVACLKACGVKDILNPEANYICKYYKWGSDILKEISELSSLTDLASSSPSVAAKIPSIAKPQDIKPIPSNLKEDNKTPISGPLTQNTEVLSSNDESKIPNEQPSSDITKKTEMDLNEKSKLVTSIPSDKPKSADTQTENKIILSEPEEEEPPHKEDEFQPILEESPINVKEFQPILEESPINVKELIHKVESDKDKLESQIIKSKDTAIDNPNKKKTQNIDEDYDSDDVERGFSDTQGGDDGDDPALAEVDSKPALGAGKILPKKADTVVSSFDGDILQREYYPNVVPDGFSSDDNFFPFFLSAVILVVVLYVLYHNKNKVSKVVLGLLVEGRQSNRRRNSRGHAYRRLDTLEQALNANASAPPSKIIY